MIKKSQKINTTNPNEHSISEDRRKSKAFPLLSNGQEDKEESVGGLFKIEELKSQEAIPKSASKKNGLRMTGGDPINRYSKHYGSESTLRSSKSQLTILKHKENG